MGGDLERYQQEIDTASKLIVTRFAHYQKVVFEIRKLLKDYFFNVKRIQKLQETPKENELVFNFDNVKEVMEVCLVDETFIETVGLAGNVSLVEAFDNHIAYCDLPIEIQKENGLYIFKPEKAYTPLAHIFMQQFTYALGIYRLGFGLYEIYSNILNHAELQQIEVFKNHLDSVRSVKEAFKKDEIDLIALLGHTKAFKKEILSHLKSERIQQGINIFKADLDKLSSQMSNLLEFGANYMQNCYTVFRNDPILWILHDRSWHTLLKNLSSLLYANYYTYSTLHSTLEIKKEFILLIRSELEQYSISTTAKLSSLKIELLREAAKLGSELKIDIQARLAEQGIELNEAPSVSMFAASAKPSIYQLMADYYKEPGYISNENMQGNIPSSLGP